MSAQPTAVSPTPELVVADERRRSARQLDPQLATVPAILRDYAVAGVSADVARHLPPGREAAGIVLLRVGGSDAEQVSDASQVLEEVPVVREHVTDRDFVSCQPFYVVYADGEAICYMSPDKFMGLVTRHRALLVAPQALTPRNTAPREVAA